MIVIKLGGSLAESGTLLQCLDKIESRYQNTATVIVPGGGSFAEQVRVAQKHWQFDDKTAHQMAILAMQQMALLFKGLKNRFVIAHTVIDIQKHGQRVIIWSPDIVELDNAGIKASWDMTSDSLAAWLAHKLTAKELILIKSAAIDPALSFSELAERNIVDSAFKGITEQAPFKINILNAHTF
jgi:aspartokinase-like uncharacterized kinase